MRLPYHLSALTQAAARAALARADELLGYGRRGRGAAGPARRARSAALGLEVVDSDANFVLFGRVRRPGAIWQGLLDRGVLVRDVGLPGWLRVTAGHRGRDRRRSSRRCDEVADAARPTRCEGCPRDAGSRRSSARPRSPQVLVELELDGTGRTEVDTGVPFFDHMLAQLGRHGGFDLTVRTTGDLEVDAHHTVEDTAIALGQALREALGDKAGIRRFGDALGAARRDAGAGRGRPVRPAVRRARRARRSSS